MHRGQGFIYLCPPFLRKKEEYNEKDISTFSKKEEKQARIQKENGEHEWAERDRKETSKGA